MRTSPGRTRVPPMVLGPLFVALPILVCVSGLLLGVDSRLGVAVQVIAYAFAVGGLAWLLVVRRNYLEDVGWIFLVTGHVFWFATPALYQVVRPGLWFGDWIDTNVPTYALTKASLLIGLFLFGNGVGYYVFKRNRTVRSNVSPRGFLIPATHRLPLVCFLFFMGILPYLLYGGGMIETIQEILLGRTTKSWMLFGVGQQEASGVRTLFWLSRAFLACSVVLAGCYIFFLQKQRSLGARAVYWSIFALGCSIVYFDQGTRSYLAMAVVPVLSTYVFKKALSRGQFRISRLVLAGSVVVALLLVVTPLQRLYRSDYRREQLPEMSVGEIISPKQDIDFYTETANAVVVRDEYLPGPLYESGLLYILVNPMPRTLWPGKPVSYTQWHFTLFRWGIDIFERGGNALPSVVGQYYINFGVLGVAWVGLLFGGLVGWIERRLNRSRLFYEHLALATSALTFLFLSFRFFSPGFHYSTVLLLLIVLAYGRRSRVGGRARVKPAYS